MSSKTLYLAWEIWDKIRAQFSPAEKTLMKTSRIGGRMHPRGSYLDRDSLGLELAAKLEEAIWTQRSALRRTPPSS